ncbi:hypothetical protein F0562_017527 [Nyssa sinensis]|uniref:Uncharacterized protein n=1 Tax=Nyssa sinensis TaxID=561372 RepID=A0A5J4ZJ27_9ASTE|nr:hypothetical protein F0562_017527 [Nyssa sinensis]
MISMKQLQQETKHVGKEDNQVGRSMEELHQEKKPVGKDVDPASGVSQHSISIATHDEDDRVKWEEWLNAIRSRADEQKITDQPKHRDLPKIPKVPNKLRDKMGFTSYYEPSVVSIGPYHHKNLNEMEAVKERAVILFFNLNEGKRITLDGELITDFAKKIKEFRNWYEKDSTKEMNEMEFIKMMLLDGCFIIMFIHCIIFSTMEKLGMTKDTVKSVQQDILILENQLPFQVLEKLYDEKGFNKIYVRFILALYIGYCTKGVGPSFQPLDSFLVFEFYPNPLHLLDLQRKQWIGKSRSNLNKKRNCWFKSRKKEENISLVRSVKELTAGPTEISLRPSIFGRLSDIHFSCFLYGRLTLPPLIFNDLTKTFFISAIAQEACTENEFEFSSYVKFLDLLIDNVDDVKVMQSAGILKNIQGNEDQLANFINKIGAAVEPQPDDYKDVKREMTNYIASKWRAWFNEVLHDYLRSPWTIIALLAGIFLLFLTAVQSYFAAFPHPD